MAPVGQACWQGAVTQCLQTSLIMSQRFPWGALGTRSSAIRVRPCCGPVSGPGHGGRPQVSLAASPGDLRSGGVAGSGDPATTGVPDFSPLAGGVNCSMNFTCRQDVADSSPVLS